MEKIHFQNEQEAAVAILFAAVLNNSHSLSQSAIETISRMLVLSSRFKSATLNELTINALTLQSVHGSKAVIEKAAPLISDEFKDTLFAMTCELLTAEGSIREDQSEVLAMTALYLGLSMEVMRNILTTFLIRNKWNVQIIEEEEQ